MKDNVLFLNMFALYEPKEEVRAVLAAAAIRSAELDPGSRTIELELDCPGPVSSSLMAEVCREVEGVYGLKRLAADVHFPPETLYRMEPGDLTALFVRENPMLMGSLAGAGWEWEGRHLNG